MELPVFPFPRDPRCPLDPGSTRPDPVSRVRTWAGDETWLLIRFDDVRRALSSPDVSSDESRPGYPVYTAAARQLVKGFLPHLDPPEHSELRSKIRPEFGAKRIEELRPAVQDLVDELIDDLMDRPGGADLVHDFCIPATTLMICAMLGVPYSDREFFQRSADLGFKADVTVDEAARANAEFLDYLDALVREKESTPSDDMIGRLAAFVRAGDMTHDELMALSRILIIAGYETTASTMALGVVALLQHPEQLADLLSDPSRVPGAVEEILRFVVVPNSGRRRLATADLVLSEQRINAGEGFIAATDFANRDPEVFHDPDVFDIRRGSRNHLTFGFGPHTCAGASLGRMELQVVFGTLLQRIPTMRLAEPVHQLPFKHDSQLYGLYSLPVEWDRVEPRLEREAEPTGVGR